MAQVVAGQVVREGDTSGTERFILFKVTDDGARRILVIGYDHLEPEGTTLEIPLAPGRTVVAAWDGYIAVPGGEEPGLQAVKDGLFAPYAIEGATWRTRFPVNQVPYALTHKEHLARIAYELTLPVGSMFAHVENAGEFGTVTATTTVHERKHEAINRNLRRLIGALWGKVTAYEAPAVAATAKTTWAPLVLSAERQIAKLCAVCSGRGWKGLLLRRIDEEAWHTRFSSHPGQIFFPNRTGAAWGVGDSIGLTAAELDAVLPNFERALDYYSATTGAEPGVYADVLPRGLAELAT